MTYPIIRVGFSETIRSKDRHSCLSTITSETKQNFSGKDLQLIININFHFYVGGLPNVNWCVRFGVPVKTHEKRSLAPFSK